MFKKRRFWIVLYGIVLISFTTYVMLDSFVITKVYQTIPQETSNNQSNTESGINSDSNSSSDSSLDSDSGLNSGSSSDSDSTNSSDTAKNNNNNTTADNGSMASVVSEDSYEDENISIQLTTYREYDSNIYVADVQVSSAEYLKTAFAKSSYGKNVTEKTSEIAEENNAILAINGDYYGAQENGYVLRNGVIYRDSASKDQQDLVIDSDGSFSIIEEEDTSLTTLLNDGASQVLSFGPALVTDKEIAVTEGQEVGKAKASNPRTAIGIIDELHYVFVVSDGRTTESAGLSLYQLAEFMQNLGVTTAYNLDGGGSSTMYFNGKVVNQPTTDGRKIRERSVSDIVYIGY